jgi:hypothetical protein
MCQDYERERRLMASLEQGKRDEECRRKGHEFRDARPWTTCSTCWKTREQLKVKQ